MIESIAVMGEESKSAHYRSASRWNLKPAAEGRVAGEKRVAEEKSTQQTEQVKDRMGWQVPRTYDRGWRVEQALQEISHLLAAADEVDLEQVLRRFGEAIGAERLALLFVSSAGAPSRLHTTTRNAPWNGEGPAETGDPLEAATGHTGALPSAAQAYPTKVEIKTPELSGEHELLLEEILAGESSGFLVPIMSLPHHLYGYLDIGYPDSQGGFLKSHSRSIGFLSSLLAGYLERRRRRATQQNGAGSRDLEPVVEAQLPAKPVVIRDRAHILYANAAAAELLGADAPEEVVGRPVYDFVSAQRYGRVDEQWQCLQHGRHSVEHFEHEIIRLDGVERVVQVYCRSGTYEGEPAAQVILQDVTAQRQNEERYRHLIETATEGIWCLTVDPPLPIAEAEEDEQARMLWEKARLTECNDVTAHLLGAPSAAFALGRPLKEIVASSLLRLVREFVQTGHQLRRREFTVQQENGGARHFVLNAMGILRHGRLTQVCGSCIEITSRVQLEQRMVEALEQQQNAIGRELHDGVGQLLTSVRLLSENFAAQQGGASEAEQVSPMKRIAHLAEEATQQMSSIYRGLSSKPLRDAQLPAVLRSLAADTDALPDLRCSFTRSDGLEEVRTDRIKLQLYRIAQEAVSNAVKYAQAQHLEIALKREDDGAVVLRVSDDGKGFDPDRAGSDESLGLYSMRYRAHSIGGSFSIESRPEQGTTVTCTVPVSA